MKKWLAVTSLSVFVLTGCTFGDSAEQQISGVLQSMHDAEEPYRSVQSEMNKAEQQEVKLFEEILALTQEQQSELQQKVTELQELTANRKDYLANERESLEEALAKSDFSALDLSEEERALADQVDEAYDARYESYEDVYTKYEELIRLQDALYVEMLVEDVSIETVRELIQQVNAQNEVVQAAVAAMNEKTEQFNSITSDVFETLQSEE